MLSPIPPPADLPADRATVEAPPENTGPVADIVDNQAIINLRRAEGAVVVHAVAGHQAPVESTAETSRTTTRHIVGNHAIQQRPRLCGEYGTTAYIVSIFVSGLDTASPAGQGETLDRAG